MTALEYLKIMNFRGFDSIEIDGFSKINLFVGKNNSGKTSILEAIFLLLGMSNPQLLGKINQLRGLTNPKKQIKHLFHNLSYNNKPVFQGRFSNNTKRALEFEPKFQKKDFSNDFSNDFSSLSIPEISEIELQFTHQEFHSPKQSYASTFDLDSGKIASPKNYHELLNASFISQDRSDRSDLSNLSEIVKRKESDDILKLLQDTFDPDIAGIIPMEDGIYFNMVNIGEYIPIHIMGDGIRRFLSILIAVWEKKSSYFLVDEIENGLHYSAYKNLWKGLINFTKRNKVQLFITTHNIETLECLKSVLEEEQYEDMRDYCKIFNVAKTKKSGFQTYKYSFEGFKDAIEHENEIRN